MGASTGSRLRCRPGSARADVGVAVAPSQHRDYRLGHLGRRMLRGAGCENHKSGSARAGGGQPPLATLPSALGLWMAGPVVGRSPTSRQGWPPPPCLDAQVTYVTLSRRAPGQWYETVPDNFAHFRPPWRSDGRAGGGKMFHVSPWMAGTSFLDSLGKWSLLADVSPGMASK